MDRRKALKYTGRLAGASLLAPGILAFLQSCKDQPKPIGWQPAVLTSQQSLLLTLMADTIVPRTSSPSASEVDVPYFIDLLMQKVLSETQSNQIREVLEELDALSEEKSSSSFTKSTENQRYELLNEVDKQAFGASEEAIFPLGFLTGYKFLKSLILTGYYTSEEGRKQNLEYVPIPGEYEGCVDLSSDDVIMVGDNL